MGPDGPITPLVEEFGTPRSDGSPAQVCSLMLAPFHVCLQCTVVSWVVLCTGSCHARIVTILASG